MEASVITQYMLTSGDTVREALYYNDYYLKP